ncbi:MAG: hypothetical protein SGI86_09845 [Deltaproteobacteria bacterium]|nr:hypothetical protein [Deltaproteobacteria bacterium]
MLRKCFLPGLWLILTIALLVPVWGQRMLPLFDTPSHLALARAWHSFSDPAYSIARHYSLSIEPVPYLFYYGFIHLLMYVAPIEIAHKLVLSIYLVAFPLSVAFLARAAGRNPWMALLVFPMTYSRAWGYGFIAYLLAIVCAIMAFAYLIRYTRSGSRKDLLGFFLAITSTYFFHILPWAVTVLSSGIAIFVSGTSRKRVLVVAGAMVPCSLLLVWSSMLSKAKQAVFFDETSTSTPLGIWEDWPARWDRFVGWSNDIVPGSLDTLVLSVLGLTLCVWVGLAWRDRNRQTQEARIATRMLLAFLVSVAAGCFFLPYSLLRPVLIWSLSARLAPLLVVALVVLPLVDVSGWRSWLMFPLALSNLVLLFQTASLYRDFSRRNVNLLRLCDAIPTGKDVLVLTRGEPRESNVEDPSDKVASLPAYRHVPSWPMALRGGHSDRPFSQGIPVRPHVQQSYRWPNPDSFSLQYGPYFDYYILRGSAADFDGSPRVTRVATRGQWSLFAHNPGN